MREAYTMLEWTDEVDYIAGRMAYGTVQYNRFDRNAYKEMIKEIVFAKYRGDKYVEIAKQVDRSPQRIAQILYKFERSRKKYLRKEDV